MNLFNDFSKTDGNSDLTINSDYAKNYNKWRKKEELQKLKDKYGECSEEETSSSEEEDEEAVELTEEVEANFYKTLAFLKEKNPKIYDGNVKFFDSKKETAPPVKSSKGSLSLAAYQRQVLMDTSGLMEDKETTNLASPSLVEQERSIKDSFNAAVKNFNESGDDEEVGGLFRTKSVSAEEREKEECDYRQWLAGLSETAPQNANLLQGLRDHWSNPRINDDEKFLRDFILNRRYKDKDEPGESNILSDSDAESVEQQDNFERKFNFRFEEEDQEFIKRYPRTVEQSMRKKNEKRKQHREEVKIRKKKERAIKDEELKRLKALKREEILEKMQKLRDVTGNDSVAFQDGDIEGDFNPEEHDKRMSQIFNDDYYVTNADQEKPEFPDLDEELEMENWDCWDGGDGDNYGNQDAASREPHCEDPDFVMDCEHQEKEIDSTKKRRTRRQSKFAEALAQPKPSFDRNSSNFEQYLDEYYSLNYEDLIGDIPCRFRYRKTIPNDFGLSVEEILAAPDKELNKWVSTKKILRRRPDHVELYDVKAYKKKSQNITKKMQCLPSLFNTEDSAKDIPGTITNRKFQEETVALDNIFTVPNAQSKKNSTGQKPKGGKMAKDKYSGFSQSSDVKSLNGQIAHKKSKKKIDKKDSQNLKTKRKLSQKMIEKRCTGELSDSRLKAYGINPKKFKNKLKYGAK